MEVCITGAQDHDQLPKRIITIIKDATCLLDPWERQVCCLLHMCVVCAWLCRACNLLVYCACVYPDTHNACLCAAYPITYHTSMHVVHGAFRYSKHVYAYAHDGVM